MSAYVVDKEHIDYLIQAAMSRVINPGLSGPFRWYWNQNRESGTYETDQMACNDSIKATEVGQMLWDENIRSVMYRYPDCGPEELPGEIGETYAYSFKYNPYLTIDPVQVIKACHGYRYQSCEHPEWKESQAHGFVSHLIEAACSALPGYEDAHWSITYENSYPEAIRGKQKQ